MLKDELAQKYFRKDLIKALQEAEEKKLIDESRYRSLVENGPDAIAILSEQGKTLYISPSITRILGYSEEDALQRDFFTLSHPDDLSGVMGLLERVAQDKNGASHMYTGRMRHKNGEWRWLEAKVRNLLDEPSIRGIVANFSDVTEREFTTEKLIQANRLYAFLSQINKAIVHSNDEETIFQEACRIATDFGGFEMAWVGFFDKETLKIRVAESSGLSPDDIVLFEQIPYIAEELSIRCLVEPNISSIMTSNVLTWNDGRKFSKGKTLIRSLFSRSKKEDRSIVFLTCIPRR